MYSIGRICIKIAGRDAGNEAVIVEILDDKYVMIDGNVRRRKCNIMHLEPTSKKIEIKEKATHEEVAEEFKKLEFKVWETKPRKTGEKPKKLRSKDKSKKEDKKPSAKKKAKKKTEKKEEKKQVSEKKDTKKEIQKEKDIKNTPKKPSKKEE